ncbi:MAG: hypothetical protein HYR96_03560 [Deltaproteobacteria bacterium]|nr:hypothetical protein [Deltaproteobacteria bacterium]MBI3295194.1 hypothetical protein [Deltaproteobacteria bacterium]
MPNPSFLATTLSVFLLTVSCSKTPTSPAQPTINHAGEWTADQKTAIQDECEATLNSASVEATKISSICSCWVIDLSTRFTPDEADKDANVDAIQSSLNTCGRSAGLPGNLAHIKMDISRLRNPAQEKKKHLPGAISKVLDKVKQNPSPGQEAPLVIPTLHKSLESMLGRPNDYHLRLLRTPISLQYLRADPNAKVELDFLDRISQSDSSIFDPLPKTVEERLHLLAEKLDVGEPISDDLEKSYQEALQILYDNIEQRTPTKGFKAFRQYQENRRKLVEAYQKAETERERQLINLELRRLDEERLFIADFAKIGLAEHQVKRVEQLKAECDIENIRESLNKAHKPEIPFLASIVSGKSGWFIFGKTLKASAGVMIEGKAIDSQINKVQMNLVTPHIEWPSIYNNSAIQQGKWHTKDGWALSGGETENSKTLVPRLNAEILLSEKMELNFDNAVTIQQIQSALKDGRRVTVSGVPLVAGQVEFPTANTLKINSVQVIGVYDHAVPKIPR